MTRSVPKCRHIRNAPKCLQKTGDYPLSLWDNRLHTSIAVEIVSPGSSRATIGARPKRAADRAPAHGRTPPRRRRRDGGITLLMPKGTSATELQPLDQNRIDYFIRPDLSESQFDAMLHERAEEEAVQIIEQALADYGASERASGRPTYDTVYGSVVNKSTGCHDVAGQPADGVQISRGGSIFVSPSGGGSVGVSVSLPGEVGGVSVSIPKARRSLSVTGYTVNISGSGFYKATTNEPTRFSLTSSMRQGTGCAKSTQRMPATCSTTWRSTGAK